MKYQKDQLDQSTHTYYYDKLNRLEEVFVSTDKVHQSRQAHYLYYDYGPLARVETGEQKVQGMDYAYTINGWMKAMNGTILNPGYELGRDNASGYLSQNTSVHNKFARDVVGYTLGYFDGDYQSIGSTNFTPSPYGFTNFDNAVSPLYNGNISFTTTAIADVPSGPSMAIQMGLYRYDQMNRLVSTRTFRASGLAASNSWSGIAETPEYKSTYSYDQNGNLTNLVRNGGASNITMDNFTYQFEPVANTSPLTGTHASNRLDYVDDNPGYNGNYSQDIDDQNPDNYGYDKLGQLTRDNQEGLTIEWFSGSRKVKKITRTDKIIEFKYSPLGQRIIKKVNDLTLGTTTTSYYAYDANGQVMGIYDVNLTSNNASLNELNIYGASRIGMIDKEVILCTAGNAQSAPVYPAPVPVTHILGYKKYEITNYLGNVNAVISDRKIYTGGTYVAVMLMNSDYYPFGMEMPGRNSNLSSYRYGYNGMEMDNEAKGDGNSYTTEFRQYDPRLGRWLSLDPLMMEFPSVSPYVAFDDNPILFIDPMGLAPNGGPKNVHYYNMIKQSDGTYKAEHKYSSSSLVVKSSKAVLKNTKTNYKVAIQKRDWGAQRGTTNVYTYWNSDGTIKSQVVMSGELNEMAQPIPDGLTVYRSDGVTLDFEEYFGVDEAIRDAVSDWGSKNTHFPEVGRDYPLERGVRVFQVQPGVFALGSTAIGEELDPTKHEGAIATVNPSESVLKGYSDKSVVAGAHTHGDKRGSGQDVFSDNPDYNKTMFGGEMKDKNWARENNVPLFLFLARCSSPGIFYPTTPVIKDDPYSGGERSDEPGCNVADW